MEIKDIITDIVFRCGKNVLQFGEPFLERKINALYWRLNREYKAVTRQITFTFTALDVTNEVNYKDLPVDWIRPFRIYPYREWRGPNIFQNDEAYTFTIHGNQIYFTNIEEGDEYVIEYYSKGYRLVNRTDSDITTLNSALPVPDPLYANKPEWPEELQELLVVELGPQLKAEYPLRNDDLARAYVLKGELNKLHIHKQEAAPVIEGPLERNSSTETTDPYA